MTTKRHIPIAKELFGFFRIHWGHLVLSPFLGFIVCSALHEAAHAVAAILQGGTIITFRCWPAEGTLGYVAYRFPPGTAYSRTAILLAPYVLSLLLAAISVFIGFYFNKLHFYFKSSVFIWGYIASLGNLGIGVSGYFQEKRGSDLHKVFGEVRFGPSLLLLGVLGLGVMVGFYLQKCMYCEQSLSVRAYTVLATICVLGISLAALLGRAL